MTMIAKLRTTDYPAMILLMCCIVGYFLPEKYYLMLEYHRDLVQHGQFWRLFTSHLLHTNVNHLLLNITALCLLILLHRKFYDKYQFLWLTVFSAVIVSTGIYFSSPELTRYVGLSGILHGVFVWGALKDITHHDKTGYLLLAGVILKIMNEQLFGASTQLASIINASVAIDAHLWGAIAGGLFFLASLWITQIKKAS